MSKPADALFGKGQAETGTKLTPGVTERHERNQGMMKLNVMNRVMVVACTLAVFASCDSENISKTWGEKQSGSYLPLEKGNFWEFKAIKGPNHDVVQHREVKGTAIIEGREYYLITSYAPGGQSVVDSLYYRMESNGDVYTFRRTAESEELAFKLFAGDGDAWSYAISDDDQMKVTVHMAEVTAGAVTIEDCKAYFFDVEPWADEEHTITLAPGVGFVREYSDAWGIGMILTKASIGGSVVEY